MAGGSRNTRSTQNNREEPSEDEELTDEVYEGVTAYLAADKRLGSLCGFGLPHALHFVLYAKFA